MLLLLYKVEARKPNLHAHKRILIDYHLYEFGQYMDCQAQISENYSESRTGIEHVTFRLLVN